MKRLTLAPRHVSVQPNGFGLLEVVIALGLVSLAAGIVGSMVAVSMRMTTDARDETVGTTLARQKLETLRAAPPAGAGLVAGSLDADVAGYFELLEATGRPYGTSVGLPTSGVFLRRWAVAATTVAGVPTESMSVRVMRIGGPGDRRPAAAVVNVSTLRVLR